VHPLVDAARRRMRRRLIAAGAAVLAAAALLIGPAEAKGPRRTAPTPPHLVVRDGRIVDDLGRTVLLRGVNVNQLGDYFQGAAGVPPVMPFSRGDLEQIAALGLNSVRLLVHWSALEPRPGVHDEAYLDRIRRAVTWARELGLYVVLDMHQDAWGKYVDTAKRESCPAPLGAAIGWDGAPEWATYTDGVTRCRFQLREASLAVADAWQSFWVDRGSIQQHLVDTWAWLAGRFKDDPTVAGYDLLNEPNPGVALGGTDAVSLGEYHRRALVAIRAAERGGLTKIVFFEPLATWSATGVGVPRPWTTDTQIVYAPHIYLGSISADVGATGREVVPLRTGFEQARREASVYGTTFWVGEWGEFGDDGDYTRRFAALEDQFQVGSAFWQWKQACGDPHGVSWPDGTAPKESGNLVRVRCGDPAAPAGVPVGPVRLNSDVLSRPYPRAFPGSVTFTSDPVARRLVVEGRGGDGPLDVWFPGARRPSLATTGLGRVHADAVPGGWRITARPSAARWSLTAG
jgi:endoglycosylceramidase